MLLFNIHDGQRLRNWLVVIPSEGHDDRRGPAFVTALVRDPRFAAVAHDIVAEGASGRYQDVMDRYVRGEDVSAAELRTVWDDTTQQQIPGPIWTGEVPALHRAVREANARLPRDRQLRVLLGDPSIAWEHVHTPAATLTVRQSPQTLRPVNELLAGAVTWSVGTNRPCWRSSTRPPTSGGRNNR